MKLANITRAWILVVTLVCGAAGAAGQDSSSQSLGDVARKARQERSSPAHVSARKTSDEEDDGPDGTGVWRMRLCGLTNSCYELSVTLPKTQQWSRASAEPRPILIPLAGHEEDSSRVIRVYAAESTAPTYALDSFKRAFLQAWFGRPEYFGQSAQLLRDEHVPLDFSTGTISHFTITTPVLKYRGLSVVAGSPYGNFGFACVFREEDSAAGDSICDAIIKSAQYQELQPSSIRRVYPDPNDNPQDDPPENEDPK